MWLYYSNILLGLVWWIGKRSHSYIRKSFAWLCNIFYCEHIYNTNWHFVIAGKAWDIPWWPRDDREYCHTSGLLDRRSLLTAWASCQIRKIAGAHAPGMPVTFSLSPHVSDPDMHHGTCVTHVPWCMPGSLTSGFLWNRRQGKTFQAFPAHAQPAISRIW